MRFASTQLLLRRFVSFSIANIVASDKSAHAASDKLCNRRRTTLQRTKLVNVGEVETICSLVSLPTHRLLAEAKISLNFRLFHTILATPERCLRIGKSHVRIADRNSQVAL